MVVSLFIPTLYFAKGQTCEAVGPPHRQDIRHGIDGAYRSGPASRQLSLPTLSLSLFEDKLTAALPLAKHSFGAWLCYYSIAAVCDAGTTGHCQV